MTHEGMFYHPEALLGERALGTESAGHEKGQTRETAVELGSSAIGAATEEPSQATALATPPPVPETPPVDEAKPCQSCREDGCVYCGGLDYALAA